MSIANILTNQRKPSNPFRLSAESHQQSKEWRDLMARKAQEWDAVEAERAAFASRPIIATTEPVKEAIDTPIVLD